jgi:hypothetical protein
MVPRVTIRTLIRVLAIERGENGRALRAYLKYRYDIKDGRGKVETSTGGQLEVARDLEDPLFLEHFLALGARTDRQGVSAFDEIGRLGPNTRQRPLRLETGVLAELLAEGINPSEGLVFCLNHGPALQPKDIFRHMPFATLVPVV